MGLNALFRSAEPGPHALAFDAGGNVYVTEPGNKRVQEFSSSGTFLTEWGDGQFAFPAGIAVDATGNIYISDTINNRILKFGPAATSTISTSWGRIKALYR